MEPGGGFDLGQLMRQAQQMQEQLGAELSAVEVTGSAGGGLVTATITGSGEVTKVKIDPGVVDPDDVETLEDLIVAALHAAAAEQQEAAARAVAGGVDVAGLSQLFGGAPDPSAPPAALPEPPAPPGTAEPPPPVPPAPPERA